MVLNITEQEKEYLMELLATTHKEMLHELHNTDTRDYKEMLKNKIELLEHLQSKLSNVLQTT
jgi:hypothetical protein